MKTQSTIEVSVVIKALNEENNIATTIESAMAALRDLEGEVILADSHSTDRTIEIASQYPIRVVQLSNAAERCCGIGGQLGYQYASGEFIWIVDGDMTLQQSFLTEALRHLAEHPKTAGVGGRVVEKNLESLEFRARVQRAPKNLRPGVVDRLDGGGVYRRAAIESTGYFTNRNLHSYEEYELAVRLRSHGWELHRIDSDAVSHFGHKTEAYQLLKNRWRSGYVLGIGELLRSALGNAHLKPLLSEVRELRVYGLVIFWWFTLFSLLALGIFWKWHSVLFFAFLLALPFLGMAVKKRSIATGFYSVISWNFYALGLLRGLNKKQNPPNSHVASREITTLSHSQ